MKIVITSILTLFFFSSLIAQTGQYDVRLVQEVTFECEGSVIYFDIEVKASTAATTFNLSEQNYRFEFDTLVLSNPRIEQELGFSGMVDDGIGMSLYGVHSLDGSSYQTISYNVELQSGPGYPLIDTWMPVGRIGFDILDAAGCINLNWLTHADYPVTFIGQIYNGVRYETDEGGYENYAVCLPDLCADCPATLSLSGLISDDIYRAGVSIVSDGNVPAGGTVDYKAGDIISLSSGFSVDAQADFSAEISDCN